MSEYIGSRIALISKSDIKYIGTLHEINSESSTVALENVKSYGTEGRRHGAEAVHPTDTVYEYIVFRGSDVKELSIVEAPKENKPPAAVPNDPAILGSARPPQYQQPPPQNQFQGPPPPQYPPYDFQQGPPQYPPPRFAGPGGPHGFPGQPGAAPGYNPNFGPPPSFGMGYGPPPPFGHPPPQFSPGPQNPIGPPGQRQPPKQDAQKKPAEMSATPAPAVANAAPPEQKSTIAQAAATAAATPEQKPAPKKAPNNRVAVPLPTATKPAKSREPPKAAPQSYADATQAATAAVAEAMAKLNTAESRDDDGAQTRNDGPPRRGRGQGPPRGGRRVLDGTQKDFDFEAAERSITHRESHRGDRRGPTAPQKDFDFEAAKMRAVRGDHNRRGVDVPKEDFDFETANAKFNKQDLVKEAIATGSPAASPAPNGTEAPAENGADADDVVIPPKTTEGYNKQASFFDDISSDLKDRSAAPNFDGRTMRRDERNKNMETFGQGSVDSGHRGGFRGRGRGRGRGQGYSRGSDGARGRGPAATAAALAASS